MSVDVLSLSSVARELRHFAESVLDINDVDMVSVFIAVNDNNKTVVQIRINKSADTFVSYDNICSIGKKIAKTFKLVFAFDGFFVDEKGVVLQYSSASPKE